MSEVNGTEVDMELEPEGGLMPEQDEVSRPAVVDTKDEWTCDNCTTTNSVADNQACRECGSPYVSEKLADLGVTQNGVMAVAGALVEHANNAAGAEAVETGREPKAAIASQPKDQELPLDFGPFNPDSALKIIFEKSAEVAELQADYDEKKEWASDAKKALDKANTALVNIIESFKKRRQQALNPSQPYLRPVEDGGEPVSARSGCSLERAGKRCIVCEEARAKKLTPAAESSVHPENEGHEQVANDAHDHAVLKPLIPKLKAKNFHVDLIDLQTLEADELQQLLDWVGQSGPVPPAILATAHVADAAGTLAQVCKNCNTVLADATDVEGFFREGELIGFECDAKLAEVVGAVETAVEEETAAAEAPVEKARTPKSHAKRDGKKRREPEKDRSEQVAAGRQRVNGKAVPKKAEPKKDKAKAAKKGRGK